MYVPAQYSSKKVNLPETSFPSDFGENCESIIGYFGVLLLAPDPQYLLEVLLLVLGGGNDDGPVQEVQRQTVGAGVARAPDLGDSSVGGHHHHGRQVVLQRPVEEGEALNVQHVNLVNEQNSRGNLGFSFFSPLGDLGIYLISYFRLDFPRVSTEKSKKSLK